MLTFTKSTDKRLRATIKVEYRVGLDEIAYAIHLLRYEMGSSHIPTKPMVEKKVRENLKYKGLNEIPDYANREVEKPDGSVEDTDISETRAGEIAAKLYPELR